MRKWLFPRLPKPCNSSAALVLTISPFTAMLCWFIADKIEQLILLSSHLPMRFPSYFYGCSPQVGYTVRFEDLTSDETKIKFLTDGMLLREAIGDPLLHKYSVVILDEAHERTIHTDVLFGVVKTAQKKRKDLGKSPLKVSIEAGLEMEDGTFVALPSQCLFLCDTSRKGQRARLCQL